MSELERYQPQPSLSMAELNEYAEKFAISKMFPDIQSAAQAFVKIAAGAELGLSPFQAMNGLDVIKGKPVLKPALLRGLLDNNPAYDYEITWETDAVTITIFKNGKKRGDSRFSMDDARKAGLAGKENYQKFERNMLIERATSNGIRWYAPGLTMGPAYVEGELTHDVEAIIPEGVTAKARTRVTAEVIPPLPEPEENIEGEVVDDDPVTIPVVPQGELRKALAALNSHQREVLFEACGIEQGMKLGDVRGLLAAKWGELDLPDYDDEPVPVTLLGAIYTSKANGSAEAFQHMLDTDEDLDPGDQASLEALA